jgi:hypothetical protein
MCTCFRHGYYTPEWQKLLLFVLNLKENKYVELIYMFKESAVGRIYENEPLPNRFEAFSIQFIQMH